MKIIFQGLSRPKEKFKWEQAVAAHKKGISVPAVAPPENNDGEEQDPFTIPEQTGDLSSTYIEVSLSPLSESSSVAFT